MTVIIHHRKYPTDINADATLEGIVELDVTRHRFPVSIKGKTNKTSLAIEHTRTRVTTRDVVGGQKTERKLTCPLVNILQIIEPILINNLITDTYSAIPGRGIHYGMRRVRKALEEDPEGCRYCLKLDMRKYYPSISHDILKEKYARLIKDKDALWLLGEIIDSTEGDTGVPIGNYLSQYSGDLYLSCLDHWVKEEKHIRHYFRYMDDIVILSDSKERLHGLADDIKEYADRELRLKVKDNWQVFPTYTRGLDFLGYRFFGKYTLLRKTTCKSMKLRAKRVANKISDGRRINYSDWCSMNSYHGWLMHCNAYRLSKKYIAPLEPYLEKYYQENVKR